MRAVDRLYEPSGYLARVYRHFLNMRPTRRPLKIRQANRQAPAESQSPGQEGQRIGELTEAHLATRPYSGYRRQFWRQLLGLYRQNPSRLKVI